MPRRPLGESIRDRGFTPSMRDLPGLIDLLADEERAKDAERAIARLDPLALEELQARFEGAVPPQRGRILRAIGRFVAHERAVEMLLGALSDADPKTRRNAVIALGHASGDAVEKALLESWAREPRTEMRRSIAASLGKAGGESALPVLKQAAADPDAELSRIGQRATMMIERSSSRSSRGELISAAASAQPVDIEVLARRGIEELVAEELARVAGVAEVRVVGPGSVRARLSGSMSALFASRTALSFRFPLPPEPLRDAEPVADAIARATTTPEARAVLSTWTAGQPRYRIAWANGGHRRALTWETAQAIARRDPQLINDPTQSLWELVVHVDPRQVRVALAPRALADPRFPWRRGDVPAASHPTLAAALARTAGARADDVVWDPFVGSSAELIERATLGPYRQLHGSDTDERALAVARQNLAAAGHAATLTRADALKYAPQGVTLIITNPPMGRRASREKGLCDMLDAFVAHAASVLSPRGRLVWLAPWPSRSRMAGPRAGLTLDWARIVDVGGFDAEMQRWLKA